MNAIKPIALWIVMILSLVKVGFANDYHVIEWEQLLTPSTEFELSQDDISPEMLKNYMDHQEQRLPNSALAGQNIALSGFVVPLEWDQNANISEFLLVPYYGACIHVPPPPKNQIVHVRLKEGLSGIQTMDNLTVSGRLNIDGNVSEYGESSYALLADHVEWDHQSHQKSWLLALILTLLSGISICIGWFFGVLLERKSISIMMILLSFSAGTMIYLSITILWLQLNVISIILWLVGLIGLAVFNRILHSKGKLTMFALVMHNIPESFVVFSTAMMNIGLGTILALTVICHNLPLGCGLALPEAQQSRQQQFYRALFTGLAPALLAIFIYTFLRAILSMDYLMHLSAFAGGMMMYVALREILPKAKPMMHKKSVATGMITALLTMSLLTMIVTIN